MIPSNTLALGFPAKLLRAVRDNEESVDKELERVLAKVEKYKKIYARE